MERRFGLPGRSGVTGGPKVFVLAFDAAEWDIVERGIDEGWLPTIARLARVGRRVRLGGNQALLTPPSWPTLVTSTELHEHQLACDRQIEPGTYRIVAGRPEDSRRPPFWRFASDAGKRSTIVSIYSAPLLDSFRGSQLVGWGTLDPFATKDRRPQADPPDLLARLERAVERQHTGVDIDVPRTERDRADFLQKMIKGIDQHTAALLYLMRETEWDLFFGSYAEAHQGGHLLGFADEDGSGPENLRTLQTIYEAVDHALGRLLEELPDDTTLFLVTPYGLTPNPHTDESMNDILAAGGWLARGAPAPDARTAALKTGRSVVRTLIPSGLRPALGRLVPRNRWIGQLEYADVDWTATKAFALPSDWCSWIRVNLAGREPQGMVHPEDYDALLSSIQAVLGELRDADSGEPLVQAVARTDEILGAPVSGSMPDLCLAWRSTGTRVRAIDSPVGRVEVVSHDPRTAVHKPEGFVLAVGPHVDASSPVTPEPARLIDFGPTVLKALGVPVPPSLPGRPIAGLVGG